MTWLLTLVLCIILVEFAVRMPFLIVISEIHVVVQKAARTIRSPSVSDHWKEKVMLSYASTLFLSTLKLTGLLIAIGAVAAMFIFFFDYIGADVGNFLIDWTGILATIIFASTYYALRKMLV